MGQVVSALMIGAMIEGDLSAKLFDEDSGEYTWDTGKPALDYRKAPSLSEDSKCIGFCYAVSRQNEKDEADLAAASIPIADIGEAFRDQEQQAQNRWNEFRDWLAQNRGIELPPGWVILTAVERA